MTVEQATNAASEPYTEPALDSSSRTMDGFTWLEETPLEAPIPASAELWCVRNAICQLMGWPPGSEDHGAFIRPVGTQNILRLAAHLGLTVFDRDNATELTDQALAHPGTADMTRPPGAR